MEPNEHNDNMSDNLRELLEIVENTSVEDLLRIPPSEFVNISNILSPEEFLEFMFAKNIKIFGGINNYVNDYFNKNTVARILSIANGPRKNANKEASIKTLNIMLSYPDLTDENRTRINNAILQLTYNTTSAPAAGGRRGKSKSKSKSKSKGKSKGKSKSKSRR